MAPLAALSNPTLFFVGNTNPVGKATALVKKAWLRTIRTAYLDTNVEAVIDNDGPKVTHKEKILTGRTNIKGNAYLQTIRATNTRNRVQPL